MNAKVRALLERYDELEAMQPESEGADEPFSTRDWQGYDEAMADLNEDRADLLHRLVAELRAPADTKVEQIVLPPQYMDPRR
jgi:hypothetical protein